MTTPNLDTNFRTASLVDSLFGGSKTAFLLQEKKPDNTIAEAHRLTLPASSGDLKKDEEQFKEIRKAVEQWVQGGNIPQKFEPLLD